MNNKKGMSNMSKAVVVGVVLFVIIGGVIPCFFYYSRYNSVVYTADMGKEWLWRARATNDLSDMAKYLNKSLELLDSYHGNPSWWFPTPDTNYDFIKQNIIEVRNNAVKWSNMTGDSYAYQQAVRNLQETIVETAGHLDSANGWLCDTPYILFLKFIFAWVWIPIWYLVYRLYLDDDRWLE